MTKHGKSSRVCAFCGQHGVLTKEHFVPKGLRAGCQPSSTKTVPTCKRCNAGASKDDEYFRNVIALQAAGHHPEATRVVRGPTLRSFKRRPGLARELTVEFRLRDYLTPNGLYLGRYPSALVDARRLDRILCKVVLGLFYVARGRPLGATHGVYIGSRGNRQTYELVQLMAPGMKRELHFGDDVFLWSFAGDPDDPGLTWWLLIFYRHLVFPAATLPIADGDQGTRDAGELVGAPPGVDGVTRFT